MSKGCIMLPLMLLHMPVIMMMKMDENGDGGRGAIIMEGCS